jgi:four helix bundle protein
MTEEELKARTKVFALDSIKLARKLRQDDASRVLGKQLLRYATSVGANYRAACLAKSVADMINKLKIAEEEADEAEYWLQLLEESDSIQGEVETVSRLKSEASQLFKILAASIRTLKKRASR